MNKKLVLSFTIMLLSSCLFAQRRFADNNSVEGKVIDAISKVPLEYSNVVLFAVRDSSQVTGTITNADGTFKLDNLRPGNFYLKVSFIGYKSTFIDSILLRRNTNLDVGEILIEPDSYNFEDVVVSDTRGAVTYEIDKKVINVSEQFTSVSGTAVDVLENVPSVTVDIEGNVSLRGSSNFTVLIDGRPSILDANDALQQLPASSIENIEIITNPSAKYNPEGTAGIINIIMKENKLKGISGIITADAGTQDRYGGDLLFDYKTQTYDFNVQLDYNNGARESESLNKSWTMVNNEKYFNNSFGSSNRGRNSYGIRSSFLYKFSKSNSITLKGRYGYRDHSSASNYNFDQWNTLDPTVINSITTTDRARGGDFYSLGFSYLYKIGSNGHELSADFDVRNRDSDEETVYYERISNSISEGQKNTEAGPSESINARVDYVLPFNENSKFEAGYEGDIDKSTEDIGYYEYNLQTKTFDYLSQFSYKTKYNKDIHAVYSLYSNKIGGLGFQAGLRAELTDRLIELPDSNKSFTIDRWDFFPTAHFSYKLDSDHQLMASYTRRIDRPRGWELEPFYTWMDPYNVRIGNPALKPEYIDSYEAGYQTFFGQSVFSIELYYRAEKNNIERIRSAYAENITLRSVQNVGKEYSFGSELMLNFDPLAFWNTNLMGNLYNNKLEGELGGKSFDQESFTWNVRFNNRFKITESTQVQFNTFYNSPRISAQGEREGFFYASIALRQEFFNKQLALTLQARDVFGTAKHESTTQDFDFYSYSEYNPESPRIMLNIRFNFNNYKNGDRDGRGGDDGPDMGGDEF